MDRLPHYLLDHKMFGAYYFDCNQLKSCCLKNLHFPIELLIIHNIIHLKIINVDLQNKLLSVQMYQLTYKSWYCS